MKIHATAFADVITASTDSAPGVWGVEVFGLEPHDVTMRFEVCTYHEKDACQTGIEWFIEEYEKWAHEVGADLTPEQRNN
jgi:hypothetical protein